MNLKNCINALLLTILITPGVFYIGGINKFSAGGVYILPIILLANAINRCVSKKLFEDENVRYTSYRKIYTVVQAVLLIFVFVVLSLWGIENRASYLYCLIAVSFIEIVIEFFNSKEVIIGDSLLFINGKLYKINKLAVEFKDERMIILYNGKEIIIKKEEICKILLSTIER